MLCAWRDPPVRWWDEVQHDEYSDGYGTVLSSYRILVKRTNVKDGDRLAGHAPAGGDDIRSDGAVV